MIVAAAHLRRGDRIVAMVGDVSQADPDHSRHGFLRRGLLPGRVVSSVTDRSSDIGCRFVETTDFRFASIPNGSLVEVERP